MGRFADLLSRPATKTVKVISLYPSGHTQLARQDAEIEFRAGHHRTVEIRDVPLSVDDSAVARAWDATTDLTWLGDISCEGRLSFSYGEIGAGRIIRNYKDSHGNLYRTAAECDRAEAISRQLK